MRRGRRFTPEQRLAMVEFIKAHPDMWDVEIAPRLNTTPPTIFKLRREFNLPIPHPRNKIESKAAVVDYLKSGCATLDDAAERFGVTRERVRQIAYDLGIDVGERRKSCDLQAFIAAPYKPGRADKVAVREYFIEQCRQHGLEVKPIIVWGPPRRKRRYVVAVNHFRVALAYCNHEPRNARPRSPSSYSCHITWPKARCDFVAIVRLNRERVREIFIAPRGLIRRFSIGSVYLPFEKSTYKNVHLRVKVDWLQYRDAWHLLAAGKQPREKAA